MLKNVLVWRKVPKEEINLESVPLLEMGLTPAWRSDFGSLDGAPGAGWPLAEAGL